MNKTELKICRFCKGAGYGWHAGIVNGQKIRCRWCAGTGKAQRTLAEVGAE